MRIIADCQTEVGLILTGVHAGIATAIRLKEQLGSSLDLTILEKASAPGGVWRDSTWSGAGECSEYQLAFWSVVC